MTSNFLSVGSAVLKPDHNIYQPFTLSGCSHNSNVLHHAQDNNKYRKRTNQAHLYTMNTRLTRKGLDICPADIHDSCFQGGVGARGGKPPVADVAASSASGQMSASVSQQQQQWWWAVSLSVVAQLRSRPGCCGSGLGIWRWHRRHGDAVD